MKLGIDLDGVLADYMHGYNVLVKNELGIELEYPATDYDWHLKGGVTPEQEARLASIIHSTPFQATLLPLPGAVDAIQRLNSINFGGNEIYFITSRGGKLAKFWAELWLSRHGFDMPTVLITKDKGAVAKGLNLDVFIDDYPPNNMEVKKATGTLGVIGASPRVYLTDHPYNRWANQPLNYGIRVADLNEVLDIEFTEERIAA